VKFEAEVIEDAIVAAVIAGLRGISLGYGAPAPSTVEAIKRAAHAELSKLSNEPAVPK